MVVSPGPGGLAAWAVRLLERFPERPRPRVGVHYAQAVYRDGDYFGTHVNLAHRVVGRAQAGEVLVTDSVTGTLEERGLTCEPIGEVSLKGFPVPTPLYLIRPGPN
jgi:adenylate cyclase